MHVGLIEFQTNKELYKMKTNKQEKKNNNYRVIILYCIIMYLKYCCIFISIPIYSSISQGKKNKNKIRKFESKKKREKKYESK